MNELREQLDALAAHVRDPATHPGPPGIEARRLKIYSDLVYNNLDGLLAGGFPVIRKTLGDAAWQALLRGFLAHHHSRTPLFTELGRELIDFLESDAGSDPLRPWLAELAHYEWAELGLQLSDAAIPPHDPAGDLLAGIPLLSPLLFRLLELVDTNIDARGDALLRQLALEAGHANHDGFVAEAMPMLRRLHGEGVLIGTRID